MSTHKLIFVYNANGGLFGTVTDFAHKLLSPSTYPCHLCTITHGNFSMKQEWKSFIKNFPAMVTFLHKNEFLDQYKIKTNFPAIFIQSKAGVKELISDSEIERCQSVNELKQLLVHKYEDYVQHHHTHI